MPVVSPLAVFDRSIKAFHDDPNLKALVQDCIDSGLEAFIETGAFRGDSLRWVASHNPKLKCRSCETNEIFYLAAQILTWWPNAQIAKVDSRDFLQFETKVFKSALFWLDAHWGDDWPLLRELEIIKKSGIKGVVIIDDFYTGDNRFQFDHYGDKILNLEYIREFADEVFVPDYEPLKGYAGYAVIPMDWTLPKAPLRPLSYKAGKSTG